MPACSQSGGHLFIAAGPVRAAACKCSQKILISSVATIGAVKTTTATTVNNASRNLRFRRVCTPLQSYAITMILMINVRSHGLLNSLHCPHLSG